MSNNFIGNRSHSAFYNVTIWLGKAGNWRKQYLDTDLTQWLFSDESYIEVCGESIRDTAKR